MTRIALDLASGHEAWSVSAQCPRLSFCDVGSGNIAELALHRTWM